MREALYNLLYNLGIAHIFRVYKRHDKMITILCLHRVSDDFSITFPPLKIKAFEKLLRYLDKHYQVTTIADIGKTKSSKPFLILSFDDGFLDFYNNALPLLQEYKLPCNLNVVVRCLDNNFQLWTQRLNNLFDEIFKQKYTCSFEINTDLITIDNFDSNNILKKNLNLFHLLRVKDNEFIDNFITKAENKMPFIIPPTPMMNWEDLLHALDNYDIELGSHSFSHPLMSNIIDKNAMHIEIYKSKEIIEQKTGRKVDIFAFPNGSYNKDIIQKCHDAEYKHVLTVDEQLIPNDQKSGFSLPRLLIAYPGFYQNLLKVENFQNVAKGLVAKIKK